MVRMAFKHCFIWIWNVEQEPSSRVKQNCTQTMIVPRTFCTLVSPLIGLICCCDRLCALLPFIDEIKFVLFLHLLFDYNMIQFKRHHNQKIRITLAKIRLKPFRFCPFPICQMKSIEIISHALLNRCAWLRYLNAVLCKYVSHRIGLGTGFTYLFVLTTTTAKTFEIQSWYRFAHHEARNTIPACGPLKDGVY